MPEGQPQTELSDAQRKHLRRRRKSILWRESYYRKEGMGFLHGGGEGRTADVYDDDTTIQAGLDFNRMDDPPSAFHFDQFKTRPASKPYFNIGHHLISCDVFTQSEGRIFSDDELTILRAVDKYDVNRGRNVIFLPGYSDGVEVLLLIRTRRIKNWKKLPEPRRKQLSEEAYAAAEERARRYANLHRLPCHWDYHPRYIDYVKKDMRSFKSVLCAAVQKDCEDWNPPASILDELKKREDRYWKWVVGFGRAMDLKKPSSIGDITRPPPMPKGRGK